MHPIEIDLISGVKMHINVLFTWDRTLFRSVFIDSFIVTTFIGTLFCSWTLNYALKVVNVIIKFLSGCDNYLLHTVTLSIFILCKIT